MEEVKLDVTVKAVDAYFKARDKSGTAGLVMLDKMLRQVAKHRNWTPLARFVVMSGLTGERAKVAKIIRLAFGNALTFKMDKTHPTGGRFEMTWADGEAFVLGNAYGRIEAAIDAKVNWASTAFIKSLDDVLPAKEKPKAKPVDDKLLDKAAQAVYALLKRQMASVDGLSTGEVIARVQALLATPAAAVVANNNTPDH